MKIEEYDGKTGKKYSMKLQNIPLLGSITVKKMFDKTYENTGQFGTFFKTKVKYENKDVEIVLSAKQNADWLILPIGDVEITKGVKEIEYTNKKDGKEVIIKKPINIYSFKAVEGTKDISEIPTFSEKEKNILNYYVSNKKKPEDKFILDDKPVRFVDFFGKETLLMAENGKI